MYFFGGIHSYVRCILESLGVNIILNVTLVCFCAYVNSATLPLQPHGVYMVALHLPYMKKISVWNWKCKGWRLEVWTSKENIELMDILRKVYEETGNWFLKWPKLARMFLNILEHFRLNVREFFECSKMRQYVRECSKISQFAGIF